MPGLLMRFAPLLVLSTALAWASAAWGQAGSSENFEGPTPSWSDVRGSYRTAIEAQRRTIENPHGGTSCELIQIAQGPNGSYVYLAHPIAPARVIDELRPSVWVRADRPGVQLLARVVFPRAVDPRTRQMLTGVIEGSGYTRTGSWQQLQIRDVPQQIAAQARVFRAQFRGDVDVREAFVDRLLLSVYNGEGRTHVWVDDLEVAGLVSRPNDGVRAPEEIALPQDAPVRNASTRSGAAEVEISGATLTAAGRPLFPRVIEHRGEPLTFLKERGFNAVRMKTLPSEETLREARQLGIWIVCPPPRPAGLDDPLGPPADLPEIGPEFDPVLAWHLGQALTGADLELTRRWAEQVRRAERGAGRPLVCHPSAQLRAYSGAADVLVLDRFPLGSSLDLTAYRTWLVERPRLARPGASTWATIQTQPEPALLKQLAALGAGQATDFAVGNEGTRLLVYAALASGTRGMLFASQTPLDGRDLASRWRSALLELLNLELDLIEPWTSGGKFVATVNSTDPDVVAAVLRTDRAHLLLPMWSGRGGQFAPGQTLATELTFVVPGVPLTYNAYELAPGGMRRASSKKKVTGGMSVTLTDFGLTSLVLLAPDDALVLGDANVRIRRSGDRAARLERDLAAMKLEHAARVEGSLATVARRTARAPTVLDQASRSLQSADMHLAAGNQSEAYRAARQAQRIVRGLERNDWLAASTGLVSPTATPLVVGYGSLPWHWSLVATVDANGRLPNKLAAGDFESLDQLLEAGWRNFQFAPEGVLAAAELSQQTRSGAGSCLRLTVAAENPAAAPAQLETPPLWITSHAVPAAPGEIVRIHGWVHVPAAIVGSPDGLLIVDSLGGEALAERVQQTTSWKEFTLYRAGDESGHVSVTFALTGLGEALIDDVTIEPVAHSGQRPTGPGFPINQARLERLPRVR